MAALLSLFFLLSGATGLIYQVIWAKQLALFFGNTGAAHTIVLATFLGGLALGNAFFGRHVDRARHHLMLYGWLELGIGIFAGLSPLLLNVASNLYLSMASGGHLPDSGVHLLRLVCSVVVLLVPTFFMGGTLPCLTRFTTHSLKEMESNLSTLYFLNSAGAVGGALISGFYLIPMFGLDLSITLAAILNVIIGLLCIAAGRRLKSEEGSALTSNTSIVDELLLSPRQTRIILSAVFISGVVSLTYEIAWIRLLSLILGSSTYSFSLMLSAFISGIALGSLLVRHRVFPSINSYILFGLCEVGIALGIILTMPLYERVPFYFVLLRKLINTSLPGYYLFESVKFFFCFLLMLIPAILIGMTLPLASRAVTARVSEVGEKVGDVFSINTLGNVLGAVLAGYLLQYIGIKALITIGVFLNLTIGIRVLLAGTYFKRRYQPILVGTAVFILYLLIPAWDRNMLASGVYRSSLPPDGISYENYRNGFDDQELIYYRDGRNATVTVVQYPSGNKTLRVNGKPDASSQGDLSTQMLLAHLPLSLKPETQSALVVGFGSGITAGAALAHPLKKLDVIEISPEIIEAATFFEGHNKSVHKNKRANIHVEDARTFLQLTSQKYDVIISEPSNPWIAGIGNLFSKEFYEIAKDHLSPDGLMVQWFHTYEMDDELVKLVLRTFTSVFPHATIWNTVLNEAQIGDYLIVGSLEPFDLDFGEISKRVNSPGVARDLKQLSLRGTASLLALQTHTSDMVDDLKGSGNLNEDRFPILEYQAPRAFFQRSSALMLSKSDFRLNPARTKPGYLNDFLAVRGTITREEYRTLAGFYQEHASLALLRPLIAAWEREHPYDALPLWIRVHVESQEGHLDTALDLLNRLLEREPENSNYLLLAGELEFQRYKRDRFMTGTTPFTTAVQFFDRELALGESQRSQNRERLANAALVAGERATALEAFSKALEFAELEGRSTEKIEAALQRARLRKG